jgi:hypothetical protein
MQHLTRKRKFSQISRKEHKHPEDDRAPFLDYCRQVFCQKSHDLYQKLHLTLEEATEKMHPEHPDLCVRPHYLRSDGMVIYLTLKQGDRYYLEVSEELVQLALEVLQAKYALIVTIILEDGCRPEDPTTYICNNIEERCVRYSPRRAHVYLENFLEKVKRPRIQSIEHPENLEDWISASRTRNYALHDTLVDWLDLYGTTITTVTTVNTVVAGIVGTTDTTYRMSNGPNGPNGPNGMNNSNRPPANFSEYIMGKGNSFESAVIQLLQNRTHPQDWARVVPEGGRRSSSIHTYARRTLELIKQGVPFIYQGMLLNNEGPLTQTYGSPDLLVRSDHLGRLVRQNPLEDPEHPAPMLGKKYHYVVVDIKFISLNLCSDGRRIRNYGSIPAYKCQLYVYNCALGKLQGYEPPAAYILGRRYRYECQGQNYAEDDCLARLGEVQYTGWDVEYVEETHRAVAWVRRLRQEGARWKLYPQPSVEELYPNMSLYYEGRWDHFKESYARQLGEITLLWNCGVKHRRRAHQQGVYSYRDPRCSPEVLGITGSKQASILDAIIQVNRQTSFSDVRQMVQMKLQSNPWMEPYRIRFVADFEVINSVFDDFAELPRCKEKSYLFLIGLAYQIWDEPDRPVHYESFLANHLSDEEEERIILEFRSRIRRLTRQYGLERRLPYVYHWGNLEASWTRALLTRETDIQWYDLCESFRDNCIVVHGCFNFGLKEIAHRLYELGLIRTIWQKPLAGNSVMVMAEEAYRLHDRDLFVRRMQEIIDYNRVDCVIVHQIIDLIRSINGMDH